MLKKLKHFTKEVIAIAVTILDRWCEDLRRGRRELVRAWLQRAEFPRWRAAESKHSRAYEVMRSGMLQLVEQSRFFTLLLPTLMTTLGFVATKVGGCAQC